MGADSSFQLFYLSNLIGSVLVGAAHLEPPVEIKRLENGANYQRDSSAFGAQGLIIVIVDIVAPACSCFVLLCGESIITVVFERRRGSSKIHYSHNSEPCKSYNHLFLHCSVLLDFSTVC